MKAFEEFNNKLLDGPITTMNCYKCRKATWKEALEWVLYNCCASGEHNLTWDEDDGYVIRKRVQEELDDKE